MKINLLSALATTLLLASCIKYTIPTPPPPGGPTNPTGPTTPNIPYGVSAYVNGTYTTFNTDLSVDTSYGTASVLGGGDSAAFSNAMIDFVFTANNTPYVKGIYPYQTNNTPYSSGITLYFFGQYNTKWGFTSYDDTLTLTNITDTTFTGTISNTTLYGVFQNPNYPYNQYDSTMTLTNMKFYLKW
jgi:hypothetical protein